MMGFIGTLFVGIFGILGKLLPGKKKDYFLKFDEAQGKGTTEAKPAPKQPQAQAKAAPAPKQATSKKTAPAPKAQPKKTAPAPMASAKVSPKPAGPVELFAPNYLLPKPTATRRRPGANMAMFMDMSREMNIRR